MNLIEQLAIQAMYNEGIAEAKRPRADKPRSVLAPVEGVPPKPRGRPRKAD